VLFAIGTELYKQASPKVEPADSQRDETTLEEDNTVTADYEASE